MVGPAGRGTGPAAAGVLVFWGVFFPYKVTKKSKQANHFLIKSSSHEEYAGSLKNRAAP